MELQANSDRRCDDGSSRGATAGGQQQRRCIACKRQLRWESSRRQLHCILGYTYS